MRKILFLIVLMAAAQGIVAQEDHLTFKGLPIDGSCEDFMEALISKGFRYQNTSKTKRDNIMVGPFAGKANAVVRIFPASETIDVTSRILVAFEEEAVWQKLTATFSHLKKFYVEKYGSPSDSLETGTGEDYRSLADLRKGLCNYFSFWLLPEGSIKLSLEGNSSKCFVTIEYIDAKGKRKHENEILSDI